MGNLKVKPNVVIDCVIKDIKDYSSNGAMLYATHQHADWFILDYAHSDFARIVEKLQKETACRIRCSIKYSYTVVEGHYVRVHIIQEVTDVPTIKITGSVVAYIRDRSEQNDDDKYVEVLLQERPIKIPGYDYYGVLLIEKGRIDALLKNIPYEFTVSLFRGTNEFLIGEVNAVKGVTPM